MYNRLICGIYAWINLLDAHYYVGRTRDMLGASLGECGRKMKHLYDLRGRRHFNIKFRRAFNRDGESSFIFVLIEELDPKIDIEDFKAVEQKYLGVAKTEKHLCYNLNFVSEGIEMTPERRAKISEANTGKIHSTETRLKLSQVNLGRKASQETKEKMSKSRLGRPCLEETKKKISQAQKGKRTGADNQRFGTHHTEETKRKIGLTHKGKIVSPESTAKRLLKIMGKYRGENGFRFDHKVYKFQNKITKEIFEGRQFDIRNKFGLTSVDTSSLLSGKQKSAKGWILLKE